MTEHPDLSRAVVDLRLGADNAIQSSGALHIGTSRSSFIPAMRPTRFSGSGRRSDYSEARFAGRNHHHSLAVSSGGPRSWFRSRTPASRVARREQRGFDQPSTPQRQTGQIRLAAHTAPRAHLIPEEVVPHRRPNGDPDRFGFEQLWCHLLGQHDITDRQFASGHEAQQTDGSARQAGEPLESTCRIGSPQHLMRRRRGLDARQKRSTLAMCCHASRRVRAERTGTDRSAGEPGGTS